MGSPSGSETPDPDIPRPYPQTAMEEQAILSSGSVALDTGLLTTYVTKILVLPEGSGDGAIVDEYFLLLTPPAYVNGDW